MAINTISQLSKLALDVYTGAVKEFSVVDGSNAIKKAIEEACGGEWNYYNFKKNRYDVYQVISEVLALPLQKSMEGIFDGLIEVETVGLGDVKAFDIPDVSLFKVGAVAGGNSDVRRQRLYSNTLTIETSPLEIKVYDDLDRFLAGRIDFAVLVDRVKASIANDTSAKIYQAIVGSYSSLTANYGVKGSFDEGKLDDLIAHVEAKTGMKVAIYGTKKALGKVSSGTTSVPSSQEMRNDYNQLGFFKEYKGTPMISIPQVHVNGTDTFALRDDLLFILPIGLKTVKVVYEGEPIVDDVQDFTKRNDRQIEFLFSQRVGIGVLVSNYFGIYDID